MIASHEPRVQIDVLQLTMLLAGISLKAARRERYARVLGVRERLSRSSLAPVFRSGAALVAQLPQSGGISPVDGFGGDSIAMALSLRRITPESHR